MALKGSSNFVNGFLTDIDVETKFAQGAANVATLWLAANDEYHADKVERLFWLSQTVPITFQNEWYFASVDSVWKAHFLVPGYLEAMPFNMGQARTTAFSIAEAFSQLNAKAEKPLSVDELKVVIAQNIAVFFRSELERIENAMRDNENLLITQEEAEAIKKHLYRLNTQIQNMDAFVWENTILEEKSLLKGKVEKIHVSGNAANGGVFNKKAA